MFQHQVETMRTALSDPTQQAALQEAVEALQTALAELSVADEERQQHLVTMAQEPQATATLAHRYQVLFDLAPDGYLVTDGHGVIQELNRAAAALLALRPAYAVGKPLTDFVVPEERREFRTQLAARRAAPRRQDWTVRLQPREGQPFDAELTVVTLPHLQGQRPSLLWHVRPHVTPAHAARHDELTVELAGMRELHALSQWLMQAPDLQTLLEAILDAALRVGQATKGTIQLVDAASGALQLVAQRGFDAPFLTFFRATHAGEAACGVAMQRGERVIVEDVTQSPIFRGTPALEVLRAAEVQAVQATPLLSQTGRLLGMFSTHYLVPHRPRDHELRFLDLLARQAADAIARTQTEAALRASEARSTAIVHTAVDAIITIDEHGIIASFNPAAERLFGYTAAEVIGQNVRMLMPFPYREEHDGYLARYRQTGEPRIIGMGRDVRAQRRDGTTFPIALAVSEMHLDGRRLFTGIIHDLTERVRMEEALRHHALLLDLSYDPIFVWDRERGIVVWNQGCEQLYGFTKAEALGRLSHELLRTVFPEPFAVVDTTLGREGRWSGELRHTTRDGRDVLVESRWQVIDLDGREVVLEVVRDITARKHAEAELRAAMEQLHLVTDAMAVPVTRCSRDLRYLWVSRPYAAWLGQSPEALVGQPIRAVVGEAAFAALAPYFARVLAGEVVRYEAQVTFPGLGPRWISAVYTPTWDAQGVPDGWVAVVLDIEEHKQAEAVLRASEARFRTMADAAPVLVWMAGPDMGCTYFNQGWLDFTGRTMDQERGDGWAAGVHPDDYARCVATYQTACAARQPLEMEYRLRHADGTYRWVLDRGVPLTESDERFEGYIGCAIDITERKVAEAVLQHAQAELEQRVQERTTALAAANEEIRRFAYIVSHDLRAPLINLRGFARELHDAATILTEALPALVPHLEERQAAEITRTLDGDIPEALGFIETAVTRMDRLIEAVLQLSRLGRQELHLEPVDTTSIVQDTLRTLAHQLTQRQVQVRLDPLPVVQADALALAQIFGNLLANAVAYLDPSRPGALAITATQHPEQTVFTVQDNGRGIAAADMPHIFEPFRRVGRQDVPGEGMGLAYVQLLVRRHGGEITCQSTFGVGTTVTFTIAHGLPRVGSPA
jgi:PAS domain S-box-containing protein